jgi:two-component system sensor histidine kinase/response regulator
MTAVPVIDSVRLDRVCMGKPEMALVFLDTLIEEATPILADAPASIAAGDTTAVREAAHSVKGMAGNIGAARLAEAALVLERACDAASGSDVLTEHLAGLVTALAELRAARDARP